MEEIARYDIHADIVAILLPETGSKVNENYLQDKHCFQTAGEVENWKYNVKRYAKNKIGSTNSIDKEANDGECSSRQAKNEKRNPAYNEFF